MLLKQIRKLNEEIKAARSVPGFAKNHDALVAERSRLTHRWIKSLRP